MATLKQGATGPGVIALQEALETRGFSPGNLDGVFGLGTEAAVIAFQNSEGLLPDGVAGPRTLTVLGLASDEEQSAIPAVTVVIVSKMFPDTPIGNIKQNLPTVLASLVKSELTVKRMVLMALSTIRAETESFEPVAEGKSRFNTSPNGHAFDLYDNRRDLGNLGPPDGERFRGRGFVQLTGRWNYQKHGLEIGLGEQLVANPELASDPQIAADLLASFLKDRQTRIMEALFHREFATARRLVNGGTHGLDRFMEAYEIGEQLIA
jgi:putative chitinase